MFPHLHLYIPLWYDSNRSITASAFTLYAFTFHSGTILIRGNFRLVHPLFIFTFHSGTILINTIIYWLRNVLPFTFHSGTILIQILPNFIPIILLYIPLWYDSNLYHARMHAQNHSALHSTLVRF